MPTEIERLYREQRAGLVRLVERELHNHHDAEDVVQTAFLDAQRALKRGTIPRNPRAWLAAIALNAARRLRRRRVNAEPLEEHAVHEAMRMPEIRAALANLPKEQRTAVLYRDLLGLSYGETADQMGTSVNAVTMLLHRGRQRLRQALGITVGGFGVWRWLKRAGMPQQIAAAKGAAAVVVATGLATTGLVAARVVAPIGSDAAATVPTQAVGPTAGAQPKSGGALPSQATHRRFATAYSSKARAAGPSTRESSTAATPAAVVASTAPTTTSSLLHSVLPAPTVSLPVTLTSPVSATVAVSTPITTVTVSTPTGTTLTVTTPITTVTVPSP